MPIRLQRIYNFWLLHAILFNFHILLATFHTIFGTNILIQCLVPVSVCCMFFVSQKRNIKRSPNGMKPLGELFLEQTWFRGLGVDVKKQSRRPRGREVRLPPGRAPHPRGPLAAPPTYFFLLYIPMYPETIEEHHETLFPPPQPSVPVRSHLAAFSGAPLEGALITEGLYINSMAPPMMCE